MSYCEQKCNALVYYVHPSNSALLATIQSVHVVRPLLIYAPDSTTTSGRRWISRGGRSQVVFHRWPTVGPTLDMGGRLQAVFHRWVTGGKTSIVTPPREWKGPEVTLTDFT